MTSKGKSDLIESLKRAFESGELKLPEDHFNLRNWAAPVSHPRNAYIVGVDPAAPDGDFTGIRVYTSQHIEPGSVYFVNTSNVQPGRVNLSPEVEAEVKAKFEKALENMMHMSMLRGWQSEYFQPTRTYNHHRFPDESLSQWAQRLQQRGLLDDPDIRWEYQKAVLGLPWAAVKQVFNRFRG